MDTSISLPELADSLSACSGQVSLESGASSLVDSLAKTSAMQANERALQESAQDSGKRLFASFKKRLLAVWDSITSCWRTSQLSLDGDLIPFSEILPKRGMTRSGSLYELQISAHLMNANESSLWPTPTATQAGYGNDPTGKRPGSAAEGYVKMLNAPYWIYLYDIGKAIPLEEVK